MMRACKSFVDHWTSCRFERNQIRAGRLRNGKHVIHISCDLPAQLQLLLDVGTKDLRVTPCFL
jgi:hypothetical protein